MGLSEDYILHNKPMDYFIVEVLIALVVIIRTKT